MTSNVLDLYPGNGRRPAVPIAARRATGPTGRPAERTFNGDNPGADRLEFAPDTAEEAAKDADHHEAEQKPHERETQAEGRT